MIKFGTPTHMWKYNIKIDPKDKLSESVEWIQLAGDGVQ
jgi:hypothetical protein